MVSHQDICNISEPERCALWHTQYCRFEWGSREDDCFDLSQKLSHLYFRDNSSKDLHCKKKFMTCIGKLVLILNTCKIQTVSVRQCSGGSRGWAPPVAQNFLNFKKFFWKFSWRPLLRIILDPLLQMGVPHLCLDHLHSCKNTSKSVTTNKLWNFHDHFWSYGISMIISGEKQIRVQNKMLEL